jgi:outer membrane immunogenic protein
MRILRVMSFLSLLVAVPAFAADMPLKAKAPPPAPVASWTGWYVGLNAGGIWSNSDGVSHTALAGPCNAAFPGCTSVPPYSTTLATGSTFNTGLGNGAGFTGGVQFGYNWQFNGSGVAGFEADIAWTDQKRSSTFTSLTPNAAFPGFPEPYTATISRNLDYLGTVRGRLGFLAAPSFLLYGTGGLAYGGARSSTAESTSFVCGPPTGVCSGVGGGSFSQVRAGWTIGAGGEWMFAPNWSLKAEYLYYDLGRANYGTALSQFCNGGAAVCAVNGGLFASTTGTTSLRFNGSIARVGVNWHFNGPVVARY